MKVLAGSVLKSTRSMRGSERSRRPRARPRAARPASVLVRPPPRCVSLGEWVSGFVPPFPHPSRGFLGLRWGLYSFPRLGSPWNGSRCRDAVIAAVVLVIKRPRWLTQKQSGQRPGEPARCAGRVAPLPGPHVPLWEAGRRCSDVSPLRGPECSQSKRRGAGPSLPAAGLGRTGPPPPCSMPGLAPHLLVLLPRAVSGGLSRPIF